MMGDLEGPAECAVPAKPALQTELALTKRRWSDHSSEEDFEKNVTIFHQVYALFLKDVASQSKAVVTNICQLLVPVVILSFCGIIQIIMNSIIDDAVTPGSDSLSIPINVGRSVPCFKDIDNHPTECYDTAFNYLMDFDADKWRDALFKSDSYTAEVLLNFSDDVNSTFPEGILPKQHILFDLPYYYIGKHPSVDELTLDQSDEDGLESLMVPDQWKYNFSLTFGINPDYENRMYVSEENITYEGNDVELPFFLPLEGNGTREFHKYLVKVIEDYNNLVNTSLSGSDQYNRNYFVSALSQKQFSIVVERIQERKFNLTKPQGGIFFTQYNVTEDSIELAYTVTAIDMPLYNTPKFPKGILKGNADDTEVSKRGNIINMIHNGIFKKLRNDTSISKDPNIVTYIMPLPPDKTELNFDISVILSGVMYPFASSFLFPIFIAALVRDKEERHLIMMEQNGLNRITYWVITYIFNYLLYIIVFIVITASSLAWQIRLFTQTNVVVLCVVFLLWGHSQVVLGFFLANFFNSPRTGTIVGYIFVITGVMVSLVLQTTEVFAENETPFPLYMMYPPFAFYRCLYYMTNKCIDFECYGISVLLFEDGASLLSTALIYMSASTVVLLLSGFYLSYVLPSEYGVRKHPLFPIIALCKCVLSLVACMTGLKYKSAETLSYVDSETEGIDEDVLVEDERLGKEFPPDSPVVIYRLRKEYPSVGGAPPYVAVKSFSLAIDRNECFGLLGPNGAGKTTLISVLTGLYEPTSGTARIAGYDLLTDISSIHHHMGVCPQFDIQYADLTCEEHLLFYARLKGVKIGRAGIVVDSALKKVNLYEAKKKASGKLSGGMRRRLSVAMACIGNPDILILDEPTTGLDPASRRQVWDVIEHIKVGRSVILTTHAMEEADYLCTRIGIMNFGHLRCVGSQSHLKKKFGTGYELKFHCVPGGVNVVERYVQANLSGAVHVETYADTCSYRFDKEKIVVSELFEQLNSVKDQIGIIDWGIKRTTLEDVFLNIVKSYGRRSPKVSTSFCPTWFPLKKNNS